MTSDVRPGVITDLHVIFQNESLIAIHKPPGMHVHQPEMARRRVPREMTVLWTLRRQIEKFLYPVHRLDVATEGVLIMALQSDVAGRLQAALQAGQVKKVYHAVCRGWMQDEGLIELPLERDSNGTLAEASTKFRTLAKVECPFPVGKRYPTARYSLVEARPLTGRWHQIRRHFARSSHPIIGDREHGDSHHSRYFRENLGLGGLWLRASELIFDFDGESFHFAAPFTSRWQNACGQLGFSPEIMRSGIGETGGHKMANDDVINHFDCDGYRPFHHAILAHDLERARALLEQGAMINAPTESGDGALVLLCKALRDHEAQQWLPLLLDHGAEILDRDRMGWTALHHCAARGLEQTARVLVKEGADPFFKSLKGERPMDVLGMHASAEGNAISKEVWAKILSRPE